MGEIVDIDEFRRRKLAKCEAEWQMYMDRADAFKREGRNKFADQMIIKAKALRKVIDKLRNQIPKPVEKTVSFMNSRPLSATYEITYEFSGLSSADLGYPKDPDAS